MNTRLLFLITITLYLSPVHAQDFYIKPFFSVNKGIDKTTLQYSAINYFIYEDTITQTQLLKSFKQSFGEGNSYGLKFGQHIKDEVYYEIGLSYFKGRPFENEIISRMKYVPYNQLIAAEIYSDIYNYNSLNLDVNLGYKYSVSNFYFYLSSGFELSYGTVSLKMNRSINYYIPDYPPVEEYLYEYEYDKKVQIGSITTIGFEYNLSAVLSMYIQGDILYKNVKPGKATCVKSKINGVNNTSGLIPYEKEIEFVEEFLYTGDINENEPKKSLEQNYSLSSFSVSMGFGYKFLKK